MITSVTGLTRSFGESFIKIAPAVWEEIDDEEIRKEERTEGRKDWTPNFSPLHPYVINTYMRWSFLITFSTKPLASRSGFDNVINN